MWLLESGSEVDARDDSRWTPLIIASSAGHEAVVRLLLGAGANINACTDQGRSPLLYAASRLATNCFERTLDMCFDGIFEWWVSFFQPLGQPLAHGHRLGCNVVVVLVIGTFSFWPNFLPAT